MPKLAFLGPYGTYTHQAAYDQFGESVEYLEKLTISDVFFALSVDALIGVVPQENIIFGTVIETYDLLRESNVGSQVFVAGEITLSIQHSLLVPHGVSVSDIKSVLSHEQALGQCSRFLSETLPLAKLVRSASTAAAATAILTSQPPRVSAAICSKLCARLYEGLDILYEGIQNEKVNYTRFYILRNECLQPKIGRALFRITSPETSALNITQLLDALELPVERIDRRPALGSTPFQNTYFVEVRRNSGDKRPMSDWTKNVSIGADQVRSLGADIHVLGWW